MKARYYIASEISANFLRQRHQIFAELLSVDFDVRFLERIPSRIPSDIWARGMRKLQAAFNSARISIPHHKPSFHCEPAFLVPAMGWWTRPFNEWRARYLLSRAGPGDVVHVMANAPDLCRVAKDQGCILVVDIIHNWWDFPYDRLRQRRNIDAAIEMADLVLSDSPATLELAREAALESSVPNTEKFILVPPGVEDHWFVEDFEPSLPRENFQFNVAFFGNLRLNTDFNLLRELVRNSEISLTLYGLMDPTVPQHEKDLLEPFYVGPLPPKQLVKSLLRHDAVVLPYDRTNFSKSIFPAKYFEALALGKPVLSNSEMTHLPQWSQLIWTSEDLNRLGAQTLLSEHKANRVCAQIKLARENNWGKRVGQLKELIDRV